MSYPPYPQGPGQHSNQPNAPPMNQTTPLAYPVYPGSAAPQPYPHYPSSSPYPSGNPSPYTSNIPGSGYPPSSTAPYPNTSQSSPYPSGNPSPFPGAVPGFPNASQSPYPSASPYPPSGGYQPAPYSSGNQPPAPYPSSASATPYPPHSSQPYPPHSNQPYPPHSSQPYPPHSSQPYPSQPGYPSGAPSMGMSSQRAFPTQQQPIRTTPTVRPANPFNARQDAEVLRKAMKGFGTDEQAIIQVLAYRSNAQRQQIYTEFKTLYGKDLISDLKSETGGYFEDVLVSLVTPLPEFLAKEVKYAVDGVGTVEETLVEVLCAATNHEIHAIRSAYGRLYGKSMEDDLAGDTSGSFKRLLVALCQGNRSENYYVDHQAAVVDAQALLRAGELQLGTDESTFNAILCTRSYPQLAQIFLEYQKLTGNDFQSAIRNEFSGFIEKGLLAIVKSVVNKSEFFAEQLHEAMKGAGTKDRALIRIIVSRSEIDLGDIMNAYQRLYGRTLQEAVASETSGDYKKTLLAIMN